MFSLKLYTASMRGSKTVTLHGNSHIFSSWSMMMVVRCVVNTAGLLCQSLPLCLALLLLSLPSSAHRQIELHDVAGEQLGRDQGCCPELQRDMTWSAGGISNNRSVFISKCQPTGAESVAGNFFVGLPYMHAAACFLTWCSYATHF